MRRNLVIAFLGLIVVNTWLLFAVPFTARMAFAELSAMDVETPVTTRFFLAAPWLVPACALVLGAACLAMCARNSSNQSLLLQAFAAVVFLELIWLSFLLLSTIIGITKPFGSLR